MIDPERLVRKNVLALKPYSSARDDYSGAAEIFLDANGNPLGRYNRYPDPHQRSLKEKISVLKRTPVANIFLGNGSDEVIDLAFRVFCEPGNHKVLLFPPTYGMYSVSAAINDVEVVQSPLNAHFEIDIADADARCKDDTIRLAIICSPNNPTGNALHEEGVRYVLENFRGMVLLDEAYADFSKQPSWLNRLTEYPNLMVMQTFSKAWGLAGVRLGMCFAHPSVIRYLDYVKPPYNISTPNQEEVFRILEDVDTFERAVARILHDRDQLIRELEKISAIRKIHPTDSNFILVEVGDPDTLYRYLVQCGIIVRNRHSVIPGMVRITVGTADENRKLIKALMHYSK